MESKERSVSEDSDCLVKCNNNTRLDCRYHTPLGADNAGPVGVVGDYHTPVETPDKLTPEYRTFLTCSSPLTVNDHMLSTPTYEFTLKIRKPPPVSTSPLLSSDSGSEDVDRLIPPKPPSRGSSGSSKLLLSSDSPNSFKALSDDDVPIRPDLPQTYNNRLHPPVPPRKILNFTPPETHRFLSQYAPSVVSTRRNKLNTNDVTMNNNLNNKLNQPAADELTLDLSVDEVVPETKHALKKFTLSPEFLQLKDIADEDESKPDFTNVTKRLPDIVELPGPPVVFVSTNNYNQRKSSLIYPCASKPEFDLPRKCSLNSIVPERVSPEFYERLSKNRKRKEQQQPPAATQVLPQLKFETTCEEKQDIDDVVDDVKFKNTDISNKQMDNVDEEPWDLKKYEIFEPKPVPTVNTDYVLSSTPAGHDHCRTKKPSKQLESLLMFSGNSVQRPTSPQTKLKQEYYKDNQPFDPLKSFLQTFETEDLSSNIYTSNHSPTDSCDDKQLLIPPKYSESPELLLDTHNPDDYVQIDLCCTKNVKRKSKEKSRKNRKDSEDHDDAGHWCYPRNKSSSTEKKDKIKYRADQSYCDLLKQQHQDIKKQRIPKRTKESGSFSSKDKDRPCRKTYQTRQCHSDPPKRKSNDVESMNCDNLVRTNESFYDFDIKTDEANGRSCEPYSKRPTVKSPAAHQDVSGDKKQKKPLQRLESFYDNKKPLERIESLYDNEKPNDLYCDLDNSKTYPTNDSFLIPYTTFDYDDEPVREVDDKPHMALVQSEWWPVIQQPPPPPQPVDDEIQWRDIIAPQQPQLETPWSWIEQNEDDDCFEV